MTKLASDVAFTPEVKAVQERLGSRKAYAKMERGEGWSTTVDGDLAAFLAERDSFFLGTVSSEGRPYIQHRGGPKGFVRVLDERTLAFADFKGNRQYLSVGNLATSSHVHLFFVDWAERQRVKIWGDARVVEDDPALIAKLAVPGYPGKPERAFVIDVIAWDANCPQHIPRLFAEDDVRALLADRDAKIAALEAKLARR
jgi:uncharacterized protein